MWITKERSAYDKSEVTTAAQLHEFSDLAVSHINFCSKIWEKSLRIEFLWLQGGAKLKMDTSLNK